MKIPAVTVQELYDRVRSGDSLYILDVRTNEEYECEHIPATSDLISYESVPAMIDRLPKDKTTEMYMFCHSGQRSGMVTYYLCGLGYTKVFNVTGGIVAWKQAGYQTLAGK